MKVTGALLMSLALSACSAERPGASSSDYTEIRVPLERLSSNEARERGRALFMQKCALCHGQRADGSGVRSKGLSGKPANFTSPEWRANATPKSVFQILSEGKRGTSMPAWPTMTDEQKWDVVAYVLSVAEEGP